MVFFVWKDLVFILPGFYVAFHGLTIESPINLIASVARLFTVPKRPLNDKGGRGKDLQNMTKFDFLHWKPILEEFRQADNNSGSGLIF